MSSFFSHLLCNGVLAPKVDKLVPPQCAASADRFPVKRLTRAPASAAADEAPFFLSKQGSISEESGLLFWPWEMLKLKQKKKVNGLQAIS